MGDVRQNEVIKAETGDGAARLLKRLINASLVVDEEWDDLPPKSRANVLKSRSTEELLIKLVQIRLMTEYQAKRLREGKSFGLVLRQYRILDRLGAGSMGVVYLGEHIELRRKVAIKVVKLDDDWSPDVSRRFRHEMRTVACLQHPNIVTAFDAGRTAMSRDGSDDYSYLVMEYVSGTNLQDLIDHNGPQSVALTCNLAHQAACGLAEAHRHHLIHRDVKPSNIIATPDFQAKLLDFGLARHVLTPMTEHGKLMGTVAYMAPEQLSDAAAVDSRADMFALGGTMFWCLTGQTPFDSKGLLYKAIAKRLTQATPSVRQVRPDIPVELDAVIARMMAAHPDERYPNTEAMLEALAPFALQDGRASSNLPRPSHFRRHVAAAEPTVHESATPRVLIVDDIMPIGEFCKGVLESEGIACDVVCNGMAGIDAALTKRFDAVLLDVDLPDMSGQAVCRRLRDIPENKHTKIIMMSGRATADDMAQIMIAGADDFLTKPFSVLQLQARIRAALRHKDEQDHALATVNLEGAVVGVAHESQPNNADTMANGSGE